MNAARDSDSPRYFVCPLTRWHRGARACQRLSIWRDFIEFSSFCIGFGGNAVSVCPNVKKNNFFLANYTLRVLNEFVSDLL